MAVDFAAHGPLLWINTRPGTKFGIDSEFEQKTGGDPPEIMLKI
ncbi:hypothetical protein [Desulfosporosinus hippei]|nr:hypothetical protein [Desulfosporosinus hippei]